MLIIKRFLKEHVTHTNVPPQAAMSLVADLNQNRGKGAALFQKRKARSEKWVVDENNVKKSGYQPTSTYIGVEIFMIISCFKDEFSVSFLCL
jgi:hypothetical protein